MAKAALEIAGTWVIITHSASRIVDRRVDVEPAVGGQRGDHLEMLGDGIEPAPDHADLRIDNARGAVDQQPLGGVGGAGQHHDVGDAGDQRRAR